MIFTIEIFDHKVLNILRELEQMRTIRLIPQGKQAIVVDRKKEFKAISLDTRSFKFNREEANER